MFNNITDLGSMFKKMQDFGGKVHEMNETCRKTKITGSAGAGLVTVEVNGLCEVLNCKIDPTVFAKGDCELIEDLVITAVNDALALAREKHSEIMGAISNGMEMPSMDEVKDIIAKIVEPEDDGR